MTLTIYTAEPRSPNEAQSIVVTENDGPYMYLTTYFDNDGYYFQTDGKVHNAPRGFNFQTSELAQFKRFNIDRHYLDDIKVMLSMEPYVVLDALKIITGAERTTSVDNFIINYLPYLVDINYIEIDEIIYEYTMGKLLVSDDNFAEDLTGINYYYEMLYGAEDLKTAYIDMLPEIRTLRQSVSYDSLVEITKQRLKLIQSNIPDKMAFFVIEYITNINSDNSDDFFRAMKNYINRQF